MNSMSDCPWVKAALDYSNELHVCIENDLCRKAPEYAAGKIVGILKDFHGQKATHQTLDQLEATVKHLLSKWVRDGYLYRDYIDQWQFDERYTPSAMSDQYNCGPKYGPLFPNGPYFPNIPITPTPTWPEPVVPAPEGFNVNDLYKGILEQAGYTVIPPGQTQVTTTATVTLNQDTSKRPKIGVAVVLTDGTYFLAGLRAPGKAYGANTWGLPGGHLEFGETVVAGALRELKEETGIEVPSMDAQVVARPVVTVNDRMHYFTFYVEVRCDSIEDFAPKVLENEMTEWRWLRWDSAIANAEKRPLFEPLRKLIVEYPEIDMIPDLDIVE